jgi:chromosome segregation ATPase
MPEEAYTRREHEEFEKRVDAEFKRVNKRLEGLEKTSEQINALALSIQKLTSEMTTMSALQKEQNDKLDAIESRDGDTWRKVKYYVITGVIGIVVGYLFKTLGM